MAAKKKITVLGGGMGAMSAVWFLTSRPDWSDYYEIDVYQMGWRLGGKGASGRELAAGDRILEHGIHMMFGFYHNALPMLQDLYTELDRPADAPMATFDEAFVGHGVITLTDAYALQQGKPEDAFWVLPMPKLGELSAEDKPAPLPTLMSRIGGLVERLAGDGAPLGSAHDGAALHEVVDEILAGRHPAEQAWVALNGPDTPMPDLQALVAQARTHVGEGTTLFIELLTLLVQAIEGLGTIEHPNPKAPVSSAAIIDLIIVLQGCIDVGLAVAFFTKDTWLRRGLMLASFGLSVVRGLIESFPNLWAPEWFSIDDLGLTQWLLQYGCNAKVVDSCLVNVLLQVGFARYTDAGAGTTLHWAMSMVLDYRGWFMYKMSAGMGDIIFAPLYQVLKKRGVNFHFFHRVDAVRCADGTITSIEMGQQMELKGDSYQPLVEIEQWDRTVDPPTKAGVLPCWPDRPLFRQLEHGGQLRACWAQAPLANDLENWWTSWPDHGDPVVLEKGTDFDYVILGISVGALAEVCADLCADADNPAFGAMVQGVKTTQTQAFQFWFTPSTKDLGFTAGDEWDEASFGPFSPVVGSYTAAYDTWADMSQVITTENWGDGRATLPQSVAYWCSSMKDLEGDPMPPRGPSRYLDRQLSRCLLSTIRFSAYHALPAWPGGVFERSGSGGEGEHVAAASLDSFAVALEGPKPKKPLNLTLLAEPQLLDMDTGPCRFPPPPAKDGEDELVDKIEREVTRIRSQYHRVPYNPSERYVLSVPGSVDARLPSWRSGYDNLFMAGDWTLTPTSAGCIEATVQSGMMCAQALVGLPEEIYDYWLFERPPHPQITMPPLPGQEPVLIPAVANQTPAPPYVARSANLSVFMLPADLDTLQGVIDQQLNLAGPELVFRALGPLVMFVAADIPEFTTGYPVLTSPEQDYGYWVPVLVGKEDAEGSFTASSFAFYLPILWVDPPLAITAGREFFGYAKAAGQITAPSPGDEAPTWSVKGYVAAQDGDPGVFLGTAQSTAANQLGWSDVVKIVGGSKEWIVDEAVGIYEFMKDAAEVLGELLDGEERISLELIMQLLAEALGLQFPLVFLKQIPSITSSQRAAYQAITWGQNSVLSELQIGLMKGPFTLQSFSYATCDPAEALGLPVDGDGYLDVPLAVSLTFDFVAQPGQVLFEVGSGAPPIQPSVLAAARSGTGSE